MINYSNPFLQSLGNIRTRPQQNQFTQPQNQFNQPQNQYDFSGWGDRLGKIEEGIAGLTKQFNSFQKPGDVAPENTGNAAPEPLEQSANAPEPLGGIESLAPPQNTGFNFDPSGGNLMSQLSSAYGGQTHNEQIGRGPAGFTQGFADFFTGEGYYADPRPTYADAPWSISDKPIQYGGGTRGGGTLDPYGNPQGVMHGNSPHGESWVPRGAGGEPLSAYHGYQPGTEGDRGLAMQAGMNLPGAGGRPNDMQQQVQPQIGAGLTGLAAYQQNKGAGI